jgi:hypothetical protein
MIAEAKCYRGVICIHCHQPTPLTSAADHKAQKHKRREEDEFDILSTPLRCYWCHGEAIYAITDVREFEGSPRKRRACAAT